MKLIIREYLASLKERDELDAVLPDLLSQLGLTVFSRPGRGTRQDGVDVAAYGGLDGGEEKVYLFSIKSGDLTRSTWNGGSEQALRPSLDEILDAYIPNRLPVEYRGKKIVVCLCFGGNIKEQVRPQVEGYISKNTTDLIKFEEWHGDKLTELILSGFLREELMPESSRALLRKSIALLDEPESSFSYFSQLLAQLAKANDEKEKLTAIRQINICLWVLYAWCREKDNLEAAYLSSERAMLYAWQIGKSYLEKKSKIAQAFNQAIDTMYSAYQMIAVQFLSKVLPNVDVLHGLSHAVQPSCKFDVNLKMFDLLGRVAMGAIWAYWQLLRCSDEDESAQQELTGQYILYSSALKQILNNNPILLAPYKDDQAIDISLAIWVLALDVNNHVSIHTWLRDLAGQVRFSFKTHGTYPCTIQEYYKLIEHPQDKSDRYRESVTEGSVLYPMISIVSALLGFDDIYETIKCFKEESLPHCNFQLCYPDSFSEDNFYIAQDNHGAVLSNLGVTQPAGDLLDQAFRECKESTHFDDLSAIKYDAWPLIMLSCRHYRFPVPIHFFQGHREERDRNVGI